MACGNVTAQQSFDPNAVYVSSIDVPSEVVVGNTITATATVQNDNDATATVDVEFTDNIFTVSTVTFDVAPGSGTASQDIYIGTVEDHTICAEVTDARQAGPTPTAPW